jgi:hypothetical protein
MIDESRSRPNSRLVPKRTLRSSHTMLALATVTSLLLGGLVLAAPGQADPPDEADAPSSIEESAEPTQEPSESPESTEQEQGNTEDSDLDAGSEPSESASPEDEVEAKRPSGEPTEEESKQNDNVCPPLDSGKIDTSGDPATVTVTAGEALPFSDPPKSIPAGAVIYEYCVKAGSDNQDLGPETVQVTPPAPTVTFDVPRVDKDISHYSVAWRMPAMGSLEIIKELSNPDGAEVPENFAIGYECKIDGDDVTKSGSVDVHPG